MMLEIIYLVVISLVFACLNLWTDEVNARLREKYRKQDEEKKRCANQKSL